jgi:SAM-dependent methyltransferase
MQVYPIDRDSWLPNMVVERELAWANIGQEDTCQKWYDESYGKLGINAQRRYPNEELLRFMGRHYFSVPKHLRSHIRILEVGCGSGANLWMLAKEGFDAHGLDLSSNGIGLCVQMMGNWGAEGKLRVGDMSAPEYPTNYFDAIVDVFSSYCLPEKQFSSFLTHVWRMLKPGGRFFSYHPSKNSEVFKEAVGREVQTNEDLFVDRSTLNGIQRKGAPFYGNKYPFRFISPEEYRDELESRRMVVSYLEKVGRTYNDASEYFEFVVIEGEK